MLEAYSFTRANLGSNTFVYKQQIILLEQNTIWISSIQQLLALKRIELDIFREAHS